MKTILLVFPQSRIKIRKINYDPTRREDAVMWAGVFGINRLSEADKEKVKADLVREAEFCDFPIPETDQDFEEELSSPFMQGHPRNPCINPACSNSEIEDSLKTIALMSAEPVKRVQLFGEYGTGVELVFQICEECHTIRVHNQCT